MLSQLATLNSFPAPALVAAAGDRATYRFIEFFTAQIRNTNTRRTYGRAVGGFRTWPATGGVLLLKIDEEPLRSGFALAALTL